MKTETTTLRSLLYVPGISEHMILKARDTAADALILDLEDGVAPQQKLEARAMVARALHECDFRDKEVFVRINALATPWGLQDARAVSDSGARGIMIPKCETADEVTTVAPILPRGKLLCLIETPRGVFAGRELAESSETVVGLVFGAADLARELGSTLTEGEPEVFFARSQVLLAARAVGVKAYDSPYFAIADLEGVRRSSRAARNLGYDGKTAIHPSHLEILNEIFAPTPAQIAEAEGIVAAMTAAHAEGRGAILYEGKMIDQVHLSTAKKTLAQARKSGVA